MVTAADIASVRVSVSAGMEPSRRCGKRTARSAGRRMRVRPRLTRTDRDTWAPSIARATTTAVGIVPRECALDHRPCLRRLVRGLSRRPHSPALSDDDTPHLLLPILERQSYARAVRDGEGAAKLAAIANLPIGWLFEDPRRYRDDLILRATGPDGSELEVSGRSTEEAWRTMAEQLAARGEGRLIGSKAKTVPGLA